MSTEVDRVNGDTEIGQQKQPSGTDEAQNNDIRTIATTVKSAAAKTATECSLEAATAISTCGAGGIAGNQSTGAPSSGSSGRSQKLKKRQGQKTCSSLKDMFNNHQGIGSWADAADVNTPSFSFSARKKSPETEQVSSATHQASASQQGDWNQYASTDGNQHPPPPGLDRASHSRNVDLANLPDRPPFEVKVANINYKSSDDDLFYFFGGDRNVVNIRSEGQPSRRGIAVVSLSSQSALVHALSLNGAELQGRSLRISLREHQLRAPYSSSNIGPNNNYGNYRNNDSYHHEGGYSTLPHPRRGPPPAPYHGYSSDSRANRLPPQQYQSYRGRDNRRYDYDSRSVRHPRPGNNQFYPRYANRSTDSYGMPPRPPPHNEDHFIHYGPDPEHDDDRRGLGRLRTESVRSSTTDGTEKHERRRLQLQPRTKPLSSTEEDLPARPTSIFGLAKPVDTYEKERQAEERLRLEDEAFKAAEQRSRKSTNEHAASVPVSPVLPHGHISILKPSLPVGREIYPLPLQETFPKVTSESVGSVEKARATSVVPQPVTNVEQSIMVSAEAPVSTTTMATPFPPPPLPPSGPGVILTARRQSFSNFPEMSDTRSAATLVRARNSYNRTFTRSRDSIRLQIPSSKQQNIPVRRGKSGLLRGGASGGGTAMNRDKRFAAGSEKVEESIAEPVVPNGEKECENRPKPEQQLTSKEQKHDTVTTSALIPAVALAAPSIKQQHFEQQQQPERQQYSKKEKKKQTAAAREMPKYVEPKPFTFSSENKYAALLEADD